MAARYWVGGTGTWDNTAGTKWALTSGGTGGEAVPTTADDVFFDANSGANTVTIGITALTNTLNMTGFTGTLAFGTNKIQIAYAGAVATVFTGNATMSVTGTPLIELTGSGGTQRFITTGSVTEANSISFNITSGTERFGFSNGSRVRNIDFTGFSGIFDANTRTIYGNVVLSPTMTTTSGLNTSWAATSGTQTITSNGRSFNGSHSFDGVGGTVQLADAFTTSSSITLNNGTFNANNYNVTASTFSSSNSNIRTLTMGSGTWTLSGGFTSTWNLTTTTNLTFNANTSTINCTNFNVVFDGGGLTYNNLSIGDTQNNSHIMSGANTFNNLTINNRNGNGTNRLSIGANITVNGTFTCNGTQTLVPRRVWIRSNIFGTNRTITAAAINIFGTDFRNITGAGAASWNDSSRTNYWGDAGGNSGITFATGRNVYWNLAGTQSWTANAWALTNNGTPAAANYPLVQDTAIFTEAGSAGTVQLDTQGQMIGNLTMADGVSNRTSAMTLDFYIADHDNYFGNITLFSNLSLTGGVKNMRLSGYANTQQITTAGVNLSVVNLNTQEGFNNTVQLQDDLLLASNRTLSLLNQASFNANNFNVTAGSFVVNNSSVFGLTEGTTKTLTMGSGTWTLSGTGTVWNMLSTTGLTFNRDTANIVLSSTSTTGRSFGSGGFSYNKLTIGGTTGTSITLISGGGIISELASTKTVAHTIQCGASTPTITTWSVTGTAFPVSGFQNILSNSAYSIAQNDVDGYRMNYLVAPDSSISGTTPSYIADNSAIPITDVILVFRPNTTPSSVTVNSLNNYADAGVLTSPANQTITSGSGTAPLVALALYEQCGGGSITTRSFSPAEDSEVARGTSRYIKYKIYNSAPSDITVGMTSSSGTARGLASFYLQFNGTSSVSFVASSTTGVVPTVQAGDIVVSFIITGDANSATPILVPVSPTNGVVVNSSNAGTQRTLTVTNRTIDIDYLNVRDINGVNVNPYTFYAGANSTNNGNNTGVAFIARTTALPQNAHILTSGTTFTIPADWNSSNNNIYMIGAGGGGAAGAVSGNNRAAGGGGGGGGYTRITNFSATPSSSITYAIGTSASNTDGGNTTWNSGAYIVGGGKKGNADTTPISSGGAGGTGGDFPQLVASASAAQNTASTTITVNVPTGTSNGDLLILTVMSQNGTWTTPSGWTVWLASANNRAIYYRTASSEPASYTITQSASTTSSACMIAYRNAAIDVMGTISANATPSVADAITTTANNAIVFDYVAVNTSSLTYTTPTGYTALASDSDATSPSYALFYKTQTTAGTTGTVSSTPSGGSSSRSTLFSIILTGSVLGSSGGSGGAGAFGTTLGIGYGAGGGGGGGGPLGSGANGGVGYSDTTNANVSGGGGGGNGGGSAGAAGASLASGAGGNNNAGTGGGASQTVTSTAGNAGTNGGGGSGGTGNARGGLGGSGTDVLNTIGSGGGSGGGSGNTSNSTATAGLYGSGGGGGGVASGGVASSSGASGSQGVIFIVYTPISTTNNFFLMF